MIDAGSSTRERVSDLLRGSTAARPALVLAPMATLTHAGLRTLVGEFGGCDLYFSEMISADALIAGNQYESFYTMPEPDPSRLIFQLVGYAEAPLVGAARILGETEAVGIDVNMGCSAPHIVRRGGGIAWMNDADRATRLVAAIRAAVPHKALSAKLRLGNRDDPDELVAFASRLVDAGVDFLTLHPKRRTEGSGRAARWSYIALLRRRLAVPVVGSGGVTGHESLRARMREGGEGPVMIGRAAARAPWIFDYLRRSLDGEAGEYRVNLRRTAERFFELLEAFQPDDFWPTRARRFVPYLLGNAKFAYSLAARLAQTRSYEAVRGELFDYFDAHPDAATHVESG